MSDDLTGKIIGWRTWKIDAEGLLRPVVMGADVAWSPGVNTAECHIGPRLISAPPPPSHAAPGHDCECGLYAFHEPHPDVLPHHEIGGAVLGWGEVELHAIGFRAEHAEVLCLVVPVGAPDFSRKLAENVAARYGVPTLGPARAEAYAMEFGRPVPKELLPEEDPAMQSGGLIVRGNRSGLSFHTMPPGGSAVPLGVSMGFSIPFQRRRPVWWAVPLNAIIGAANVAVVAADGTWINALCAGISFGIAGWFAAQRQERK